MSTVAVSGMRNWNAFKSMALPDGDSDDTARLADQVHAAGAEGKPLRIVGGGTKGFLADGEEGRPISTACHAGVVHYEPTELVLTARAGTPLATIESALGEQGQMLGFEPPHFGASATWGGVIACGLSGPRRPYAGSVRDFVLGCRIINGRGEVLSFGGEVMKNVAGFDVSRLMAGARGTLGLLLEVSVKVLPRPVSEIGLSFECTAEAAHRRMLEWSRTALPLSGMAFDGRLHLRLSGDGPAVEAAAKRLGGQREETGDPFWVLLKEHTHRFFEGEGEVWRLSVPPASSLPAWSGQWLLDWGGAQRWLRRPTVVADEIFAAARAVGGHASLFRTPNPSVCRHARPDQALAALHRRLKGAFDPMNLFNRRQFEGMV